VTLSHHKIWVFAISGLLISSNLLYVYVAAPLLLQARPACPADRPEVCVTAGRFSRIVLWTSAAIYAIGVFSAFVLGPLLMRFG
jgi:hypothetical protein